MSTDVPVPTPIVIPVHCAPKKAPCPKCGKRGRRTRTLTRTVRTLSYKAVAVLEITYGEYQARCDCSTTFRTTPQDVLPKAKYDNKVRDLVLERILDDGMSIERVLQSLQREFFLNLSTGYVYDVLRDHAAGLDMAAHRRKVLEHFSGTLCVDELHLGRFTLLLATDPLANLPVDFALVASNDQAHMGRFLGNLRNHGLQPKVVVTDGSNLYPAVLAELWPDADHQLCVFHVVKDINKLILDAVRRLRTAMGRRGKAGRKKKRGRKGAKSKAAAAQRGMTLKEKAGFIFKRRHLIVKRTCGGCRLRARRAYTGGLTTTLFIRFAASFHTVASVSRVCHAAPMVGTSATWWWTRAARGPEVLRAGPRYHRLVAGGRPSIRPGRGRPYPHRTGARGLRSVIKEVVEGVRYVISEASVRGGAPVKRSVSQPVAPLSAHLWRLQDGPPRIRTAG